MKKSTFQSIVIIIAYLLFCLAGKAQNVTKDSNGNYIAVKSIVKRDSATNTGKTFTDTKGNVYPVLISAKGRLFYVRTSKAGNDYKVYLKLQ